MTLDLNRDLPRTFERETVGDGSSRLQTRAAQYRKEAQSVVTFS